MGRIKINKSSKNQPLGFFLSFFNEYDKVLLIKIPGTQIVDIHHIEIGEILKDEVEIGKWEDYTLLSSQSNRKLRFKIYLEAERSKKLITEKISSFDNAKGKIESYLKAVISDLKYIISKAKFDEVLSKFPFFIEILFEIVDFLFKRYYAFLYPLHINLYQEAEAFLITKEEENEKSKKQNDLPIQVDKLKTNKKGILALKWINDTELNTTNLYKILTDNSIIPNDTMTIVKFKMAFSGELLVQSLDIKWSLEKSNSIKAPLIRIIKTLMEELKVIEHMGNGKLAKVLPMIFVNKDGIQPEHMIVTLSARVSPKINNITEQAVINQLRTTFIK